ncbi:hypothetical protein [Scytonema millei]|uniref:Uncharacterized protein n=1 Tax=Scytonema millei VB511283 TaxID=1245923 RepID=A0A9X5E3W3_9CYAN|nr:hypothetical protein [Scytonema millei]NHC34323.1 hypothetical protein [Scytonema millei VB511283]
MAWQLYGLDREAQQLVLQAKSRQPESLNQSYKMRLAVAYGLERFWGEHLRLQRSDGDKARYWKNTWDSLVKIMAQAGLKLPNDSVRADDTRAIQAMSEKLWQLDLADQRYALAVLTQLCDCLVWWTQRYKGKSTDADS